MRIHGAGCCLIDTIYMNCRYDDDAFSTLWSKRRGDGGLIEGGLVFTEDLESFSGMRHADIVHWLSSGRAADKENVGGPAIVALIHVAQILAAQGIEVSFYGAVGEDDQAELTRKTLDTTPLQYFLKAVSGKPTPTTEVFDDPTRRNGKGERSFINTIGAAWEFSSRDLPQEFYDCDVMLLGGTALVPNLHDDLHMVLRNAKARGIFTVVGTVYDFRHEKKNPDGKWPLGNEPSYQYIDLLVSDEEEALRLTGTKFVADAVRSLISFGVGAFIITRGALPMIVWSSGRTIEPMSISEYPVSGYIDRMIASDPSLRKDTTGCGDNFLGGVLVAVSQTLGCSSDPRRPISMANICAWGAASGGFACTYYGGTFHERESGEKGRLLEPVVQAYLQEMGEQS